jgi:hypothetical protein
MKTIVKNLTRVAIVIAVALGTGWPQSTAQELRLTDLKAQQPQETIRASAPCQRAREAADQQIIHRIPIDPATLVPDLNTLIEKSDEVVLATYRDHMPLLSPSGESAATYYEVRVIRSWKGSHRAGDILTFGFPGGYLRCELSSVFPSFSVLLGGTDYDRHNDYEYHLDGPDAFVLFLRKSEDNEKQLVQGLRAAAGEGVQGIFPIEIPFPSDAFDKCFDRRSNNVQPCDSYLENSKSPALVPYVHDPLRKKYGSMSVSDFLHEVQSVVAAQGLAEKLPLR